MMSFTPVTGSLLVASATLVDPNFARCVLLVLDSEPGGTLGVTLNRPSATPVGEVLETWQDMTTTPGTLFHGGPVGPDAALALGAMRGEPPPSGWQPLTGSLGMVDLDTDPEDFLGRLTALRVYAGYAGWSAGQLEAEIAEGSWHVVPSTPADLFSPTPDRVWADVLRRQDAPLSLLATLPQDVTMN